MKLNYKWSELYQHEEDKSYYWTNLDTPFCSFTIATNLTEEGSKYNVLTGWSSRPLFTVNTIKEGKKWVNDYLVNQTKAVLESIVDENPISRAL